MSLHNDHANEGVSFTSALHLQFGQLVDLLANW